MGKTLVTNTYWKLGFWSETQVCSIARLEGEQKSLLLSWIMFSFEVNCRARKKGGLGEPGQDPPGILIL